MSDKLFSDKRWTEAPKAFTVGQQKSTPEEKKQHREKFNTILKEKGILK